MPQPHIVIYTTASCPYCHRAKALLNERGLAFEEISVDGDPAARATMTARANGLYTVPQIFFGDRHIGGCDDLHDLDARGELQTVLADAAQ
ncbi:MAG TPA: glutaredoxin 3 [Methylovirgula sp.]